MLGSTVFRAPASATSYIDVATWAERYSKAQARPTSPAARTYLGVDPTSPSWCRSTRRNHAPDGRHPDHDRRTRCCGITPCQAYVRPASARVRVGACSGTNSLLDIQLGRQGRHRRRQLRVTTVDMPPNPENGEVGWVSGICRTRKRPGRRHSRDAARSMDNRGVPAPRRPCSADIHALRSASRITWLRQGKQRWKPARISGGWPGHGGRRFESQGVRGGHAREVINPRRRQHATPWPTSRGLEFGTSVSAISNPSCRPVTVNGSTNEQWPDVRALDPPLRRYPVVTVQDRQFQPRRPRRVRGTGGRQAGVFAQRSRLLNLLLYIKGISRRHAHASVLRPWGVPGSDAMRSRPACKVLMREPAYLPRRRANRCHGRSRSAVPVVVDMEPFFDAPTGRPNRPLIAKRPPANGSSPTDRAATTAPPEVHPVRVLHQRPGVLARAFTSDPAAIVNAHRFIFTTWPRDRHLNEVGGALHHQLHQSCPRGRGDPRRSGGQARADVHR